jgi:hypothetical protein
MSATAVPTNDSPQKTEERPKCGIVMPISEIDGLSELHWADVLTILSDSIADAGFEPNLVSTTDEVGIIQKTIVQNLYDNPIVVCDVSGKNPNVMFELGMRLAFDRPTVIVKDDKTSYTFDTSQIQHLGYPRDLRFNQIVDFKTKLASKLKNTHKRASSDPEYTTFLKHFGEFKVAKIDNTEVSPQEYIIEELKNIRQSITKLERSTRPSSRQPSSFLFGKHVAKVNIPLDDSIWKDNMALRELLTDLPGARIFHAEHGKLLRIPKDSLTPSMLNHVQQITGVKTASEAESIGDT